MHRKGFTLIELLVVISIIGLLSGMVTASLNSAREKARIGAARQFASQSERMAGEKAAAIWDFDECTGSATVNRAGTSGNGTLTNMEESDWSSTNTVSGIGCSLQFDGVNEYADMGDFVAISGTDPFTISAWFLTERVPTAYDTVISKSFYTGTRDAGWKINLRAPGDARIIFNGNNESADCIGLTGPIIPVNQWQHILVTSDGATGKMYLNGKHITTSPQTCGISAAIGTRLIVGARYGGAQPFKGNVDSVRIFSKELTAAEAFDLYAYDSALFLSQK